jgi:hypothetical protein
MPSDRLARALLRLYPRAWRARYGDEFLAFIDDSGLSWRAVANVVAAAGAERVRALVALVHYEDDPALLLPWTGSRPAREVLAEGAAYMVFVGLTVWAGSGFGVPYPPWTWWFNVLFFGCGRGDVPTLPASWFERLAVPVFWFTTATALASLAWLTGVWLGRVGVPTPSDPVVYTIMGTWAVCAGVRWLYCMVRTLWLGSTWPGMHRREKHQWSAAWFVVAAVLALTGPSEALRTFWPVAMIFWLVLRPPFFMARAGAARRRADYEKIFGNNTSGPHSPAST